MPSILPAQRCRPADDLWIVTCFFNPVGYRTKPANYERFLEPLADFGQRLVVVECAFADEPFTLPADPRVRRVRARDVMWQKERLLNAAVAGLPAECRKVAWLDCDILFDDPDWAVRTSRLLDKYPVVQPFAQAVRLPRGVDAYRGEGEVWRGFAAVAGENADAPATGDFRTHGHTGFAWAARRELLAGHGLYDGCITGSADHLMAHAFVGDWDTACVRRTFYGNDVHRRHFAAWAGRAYRDVRARVGVVPGTVLHLWHGDTADRCYVDRNRELAALGFDPAADVRPGSEFGGCWEWNSDKPALHRWAERYFRLRREDGTAGEPSEIVHAL